MTTYRSCKNLTAPDAAYIAGLIDGEGTITLTRRHRNEQRQLAVTISSTEKDLLDFVLEATGVGKITGKRTYAKHHLRSYTYAVHNRQALALLQQTRKFLRSYKAKRTDLVLTSYLDVTPRNGKYTPPMLQRREDFEAQFFAIKVAIADG